MKKFLLVLLISGMSFSFRTHAILAGPAKPSVDQSFHALMNSYVTEFLRRNPEVNTYLGGAGLDPSLKAVDGTLRDYSANAIAAEDQWLNATLQSFERIDPKSLSSSEQIDREVAIHQIRFMLHLHDVRHYQQRALDSYTDEPFRSVDWQLQGMTETGASTYGTADEWSLVAKRVASIPAYLAVAEQELMAGVKAHNTPDYRELRLNGIDTPVADADYFSKTLPQLAEERITGPQRQALLAEVHDASQKASAAYLGLRDFVVKTFFLDVNARGPAAVKPEFRGDRFPLGEVEYNWALKNNLHVQKTAAELYAESWPVVQATQRQMVELARQIGKQHGWKLPAEGNAAVRAVFDELSKDYPQSDAEMIDWYRQTANRLVAYGRKTGMFDIPADYKLDVTETPPPLRAAIDGASYYPAPPFKNTGVGRFYVTPTDNDPAGLQANNRAALADLASHEGFPGHDWHYKVMTQYRAEISPVRWLTPGEVEGSSSMWEDSMAAEGWAHYTEALLAEPEPGASHGFYTPEEHLYELQGQLYRDLRVRIDTGIHTGRMKYDQAVDLFSQIVDFLPGSCHDYALMKDGAKKASCKSAEAAIYRYSKWPTQAITYHLGKEEILALRHEAERLAGKNFSLKQFHLLFMKQGTIPPGYFKAALLAEIRKGK